MGTVWSVGACSRIVVPPPSWPRATAPHTPMTPIAAMMVARMSPPCTGCVALVIAVEPTAPTDGQVARSAPCASAAVVGARALGDLDDYDVSRSSRIKADEIYQRERTIGSIMSQPAIEPKERKRGFF